MKSICVANQKGGVGKTTTAVTLARSLANKNQQVLLIDFDPQGSCNYYLKVEPKNNNLGSYDFFQVNYSSHNIYKNICPTKYNNLFLLPASLPLATVDKNSSKVKGLGLCLKSGLDNLKSKYDFCIIDCPPMMGALLINALIASDLLIIPVQTEYLAIQGLKNILNTLTMIENSISTVANNIDFIILPTLYDQRTKAHKQALAELQEIYTNKVCPVAIPIDTKLRESCALGMTIIDYAPNSLSSISYSYLMKYVIKKLSNQLQEATND